jgi:hypothetical protein
MVNFYNMINRIKACVVNMPEDVVTPQFQSSTRRGQPLNRQLLRQLQYDPTATPTSTRPQEWVQRDVSLEQELEELQQEQAEAAASNPASARTTPGIVARNMARGSANANSQLKLNCGHRG